MPLPERPTRASCSVLCFAISYPMLLTLVYFVLLKDQASSWQMGCYGVGKVLQFALPLFCVMILLGNRPRRSKRPTAGLAQALAFGAVVMIAALLLYQLWLGPAGLFDGPDDEIRKKVMAFGVTNGWQYLLLALFYALVHSFLEEYYWRWFVFNQLRQRLSLGWSVFFSSVGFTGHHVVVLAVYFGITSIVTYLLCLAVAIGGVAWALLYERHRSLLGPWLSHALVDGAIFAIGYLLVRDSL